MANLSTVTAGGIAVVPTAGCNDFGPPYNGLSVGSAVTRVGLDSTYLAGVSAIGTTVGVPPARRPIVV